MNAEFSVTVEYTMEIESGGVVLTVFNGPDSDGEVFTAPWQDLVDDLLDMSTYDDDGRMDQGDKDYVMSVHAALLATAAKLKEAVDAAPSDNED